MRLAQTERKAGIGWRSRNRIASLTFQKAGRAIWVCVPTAARWVAILVHWQAVSSDRPDSSRLTTGALRLRRSTGEKDAVPPSFVSSSTIA
jgi:hypothetical protein